MVKRCGKSAPRGAQATRHGKPHRVQGQIGNRGAARSASAKADRFRVLAAETNDSLRSQERRQKSAYSPSRTNSSEPNQSELRTRRQRFGVRWQSAAATLILVRRNTFESGVALRF